MGPALTTDKVRNKILILGMKNSGKTTILYQLKLGKHIDTAPTIEFNVENIKYRKKLFSLWDIRDQKKKQTLMTQHFLNAKAIVYVIDSNNRENSKDLQEQFKRVTNYQSLKNVPMVIALNKQDLNETMTSAEINETLKLHEMTRKWWHVQPVCALTGEGINECLDWICDLDKHDLYIH